MENWIISFQFIKCIKKSLAVPQLLSCFSSTVVHTCAEAPYVKLTVWEYQRAEPTVVEIEGGRGGGEEGWVFSWTARDTKFTQNYEKI